MRPMHGHCACGGTCPKCSSKAGIQKKLEVGASGDRYEREADRISEQVLRMPEQQGHHRAPVVMPLIQRSMQDSPPGLEAQSVVNDVVSSPGEPLGRTTRAFFEARFNRDFSDVRVYDDARAAESARAINARAYTVGGDIVFGAAEYAPETNEGKRLLAHELTHTVQQQAAGQPDAGSKSVVQRAEPEGGAGGTGGTGGGGKTIVIYAGGYPQPGGGTDADEANYLNAKRFWLPATKDFKQTADDTQGHVCLPAKEAGSFIGPLQKTPGPFSRIVFIGHGTDRFLSLSGDLGGTSESLEGSTLAPWQDTIDAAIKPKLTAATTMDLFSCEAGGAGDIMEVLAAAFGVCVRAYADGLKWCVGFNYNETDPTKSVITSRGRWAEPGGGGDKTDCSSPGWIKGVASKAPPVKSKTCP
jgi:hypothetical protein